MADRYGGYDDPQRADGAGYGSRQDDLAYGDDNYNQQPAQGEGDRGILSDTFNRFRTRIQGPDESQAAPLGNPQVGLSGSLDGADLADRVVDCRLSIKTTMSLKPRRLRQAPVIDLRSPSRACRRC